MKQLTAKAFEHANVTGKKLQYIRITNGKEEVIINVGKKTFEGVTKLEEDEISEGAEEVANAMNLNAGTKGKKLN